MPVWRYKAMAASERSSGAVKRGELAAQSAAEVRSALRRIGLCVLDVRLDRRDPIATERNSLALSALCNRHLRRRRRGIVSELCDSLATMVDSGLPLIESIETVARSIKARRSRLRVVLIQICERLRSGGKLHECMASAPHWFDPLDVVIVQAGEEASDVPCALRRLTQRHERSEELAQRLAAALAYPAIVALVGVAVAAFLSVKTLPDLANILVASDVEVPALTLSTIHIGEVFIRSWRWAIPLVLLAPALFVAGQEVSRRLNLRFSWFQRRIIALTPQTWRRIETAGLAQRLAELIRSGIPVVQALRLIAPGFGHGLRDHILQAAATVERGGDLGTALSHEHWCDAEFVQILTLGQATGDLDSMLERVAARYSRRARRHVDRLATFLEPAAILALASLVGLVVIAVILPLVRLQEAMS